MDSDRSRPQPQALARRTALLTASFYDRSGAIGDGLPSPTTSTPSRRNPDRDFDLDCGYNTPSARMGARGRGRSGDDSDDEYTLTGYGEMSTDELFTLPPSPTQTIKYRYRAYRPKLARIGRKHRTAANGRTPLKTKSSAYHTSVSLRLTFSMVVGTWGWLTGANRTMRRSWPGSLAGPRSATSRRSCRSTASPRTAGATLTRLSHRARPTLTRPGPRVASALRPWGHPHAVASSTRREPKFVVGDHRRWRTLVNGQQSTVVVETGASSRLWLGLLGARSLCDNCGAGS